MARPKLHSHRLGAIYVKPEWAVALDKQAAETGSTISAIIRDALADYIRKHKIKVDPRP
jgi:predicted transcriptional regulator